ncbi:MAG: aminotransferase class I/II-fold pyridoxal phosphate-dependent enzyme, partial [Planctomycetes bacterium]|nr:aminotransferase class I/II-fold pyridoxal phosphate-dependent enzyme [Planctomycetota bacterium]
WADVIATPIAQSSTFIFQNAKDILDYTSKKKTRFEYGRYGNPTEQVAARRIASLEGAEDCQLFASGMSAVTIPLLALLSKGDHIIITDDIYKKTWSFCTSDLLRFGVECSVAPMGDYKKLEAMVQPNTKIIFSESPTNPYLYIVDLERLGDIARRKKALLIIDGTFATPYNQQPLRFGVDLVVHSATKYFGGHNDLLAGAIVGPNELVEKIRAFHKTTGAVIDPHCAFLLIRGLKTFPLRVERSNESAMRIAKFLESHPKVERVYYPGLKSHPQHKVAKKQMQGYGGVVTFLTKGNLSGAKRLLNSLELCFIGPSLGGTETLITHPGMGTYYDMTRKQRYELGITDTLFRIAIGMEDPDDLIADLKHGLKKV